MKTLYLECNMGASGDMLMAALCDLLQDPAPFVDTMNHLGLPGVTVALEKAESCGVHGAHMRVKVHGQEEESHDVPPAHEEHGPQGGHEHMHGHGHSHEDMHEHDHMHGHIHEHEHEHEHAHGEEHTHEHTHEHGHHHHTGMGEIEQLVAAMPVSEQVKKDVRAVYALIAEAESRVHGTTVEQIHFHEVGSLDAVADITGVCLLMELLAPEKIVASPVHVGCGQVQCAHGVLPVPAPATALLLQGIPCYGGQIQGELCTPTGAALLRHFVQKFGVQPVMTTQKIGYGVGSKQFAAANLLRAYLGESEAETEKIVQISCNLDDATGEQLGFAQEQLLKEGALDVYYTPIQMKKNRPGVLLGCLCLPQDAQRLSLLILKHTTTLGVRSVECSRVYLRRDARQTVKTPYGLITIKTAEGYGLHKTKPEYDELAVAAQKAGVPLETVRRAAMESFLKNS